MPLAFLAAATPHGEAGHPDAAAISLMLLLVFGVAKLLAELFEMAGQPGIVGEILAGVVLGPSVLNWVQPNASLSLLAELGVMFLLFRVGLEVKASDLVRVGGRATAVAVGGVVLPFAAGWGIMAAWGTPTIESIFVGAALVATSVGITARVLAAKGLLDYQASRIILAAAVIDDILGLLVLAVVSSMAKGSINIPALLTTAAMAIGFTLIVLFLGTRAIGLLVPRAEQTLQSGEAQFNLAMVLLFGLSLLATYTGVAAIIGAFLAGMALAESASHRVHDLSQGITELLVPFFLAGIGLQLDVRSLGDPGILLLAAVITAAACVTKMVGCALPAWGLGRPDAFRIGAGMIPRGEVGMVVAQLGKQMGVVEDRVYAVVVVMAVLTTVIAPPLLSMAFRGVKAGQPEEQYSLG